MKLSENLKKIRKENNLSQEDLAEKIGVSRQSVSKWESGSAYPEMDKMVQICNIFNLNIDDLLNQDIEEVNNAKQSKNALNKYINDFLNYITKTVNMFSDMSTKTKIKCIFEQLIIIGVLSIIFSIIGSVLADVFGNLFSFLSYEIYNPIYGIFKAIYIIATFILAVAIVLHIFKTRYLDYYQESEKVIEEKEEIVKEIKKEKEVTEKVENKNDKLVIRDPKHSEYRFINGLVKAFIFGVKIIAFFIAFAFCFTLVGFAVCLVSSFMFVKTGLMFIGILLILLAAIGLNFVVLRLLYAFIFNNKFSKILVGIISFLSIFMIGVGIGLVILEIPEFEIVSVEDKTYFKDNEITIEMADDLVVDGYNIEFVESKNKDVKIVMTTSEYNKLVRDHSHEKNAYIYYQEFDDSDIENIVRNTIDDINDKKIVLYGESKITVYSTKENIAKIKENVSKYYDGRVEAYYDEELEYYQNKVEELETQLEEKRDIILVD